MEDRIEKQVVLQAPVSRVWRALTDSQEFGAWFGVKIEGSFAVGQAARGQITHPDYEHLVWEVTVQAMEPERLFSFMWHPYAIGTAADYAAETPTLVELRLEMIEEATLLTVTESGFATIPSERRALAFRMNEGGWTQQMKNIESYVAKKS